MDSYSFGYREVIPDQTLQEKWKEITFTLGTSQSTLQDIKVPERAGGYCYQDSSTYVTRNRFIYWRIQHDQLELVEHSLDVNLANCRVRYKFVDTPLLDGITIHETFNSVIILVITVSTVHKLTFAHPTKYKQVDLASKGVRSVQMQSIFNEASNQSNSPEYHIFQEIPNNGTTNTCVPHASSSWLVPAQNRAFFALAYNSGLILLLKLDCENGTFQTQEIKMDYSMPRFLSGLATAFRGRQQENQVAMSLAMFTLNDGETYLFSLCRGGELRMWSCKKVQCLCVEDCIVNNKTANNSQTAQNFLLRKSVGNDSDILLGSYLKFEGRCEFSIFRLTYNSGVFRFHRICSLLSRDQHLVDFAFSSQRLWAAWRTSDFDTIAVKYTQLPLDNSFRYAEWRSAVLEQPVDKEDIPLDLRKDPRQIYVDTIFRPGQFSITDIIRALNIYRRQNTVPLSISRRELKERVSAAVEAEIQNEIMDYEVMDEDYIEIVTRCWSKFYSCVVQYHVNSSRLVGLLLLPNVHGAVILKKSLFSVLRPMKTMENFVYNCKQITSTTGIEDFRSQELIKLMTLLGVLEKQVPEDFRSTVEKELYHLKSPEVVIEYLLPEILETNCDMVFKKLEGLKDVTGSMAMLLDLLTHEFNADKPEPDHLNISRATAFNFYFSSELGTSIISKSVAQIADLRFSICCNLLLLQQIALVSPELLDSQSAHAIKSTLVPRTVVLAQAYFVVKWICESQVSLSRSQAILDNNRQRLSALQIFSNYRHVSTLDNQFTSMLEYFVHGCTNKFVHNVANESNLNHVLLATWHNGMHSYISIIFRLIWPITDNFTFSEWLLCTYQFTSIAEYVRLLSTWCEWNGASRKFVLAVSYLESGEPHKACDLFLKASNGIATDPYLNRMFVESGETTESQAQVLYYLKVIELFDQHNEYDCITELAETAMTVADPDDPNLPTLHSIIFTHHLNLEHFIEAYHYLGTNPESARRVDCLRQLIVTLFNKKKLLELLLFPYVEMYEDLERIIENRARSVNLLEHNYYDFLYSFHVNKGNARKAATVMYEQATRLKHEKQNLKVVSKQAQCLLACINALHLVSEKYKWIVRPVLDQNCDDESEETSSRNGELQPHKNDILGHNFVDKTEVLEMKDIENEYLLVEAKLKICEIHSSADISPATEPSEIVSILSNSNLYAMALKICDRLNICKNSVFETLASRCVKLGLSTQQTDIESSEAWLWLSQNETADVIVSCTRAPDAAWRILEHLMGLHEPEPETRLHKCVVQKLFYHGAFVPNWLLSSYKKRNPAELLRLMLRYGRLLEAGELSIAYIQALLGRGKEHFNFKSDVYSRGPCVYLPYNTIEILLLELEHAKTGDEEYVEVHEQLKSVLDNYLKAVTRLSDAMTKAVRV